MKLDDFMRSAAFHTALKREFYAPLIANWALADLRREMPKSQRIWRLTIEKSGVIAGPKTWLMIIPKTHPIAGIYPLLVAVQAGLKVFVRRPTEDRQAAVNIFLRSLRRFAPRQVTLLPQDFRIGQSPLPPTIDAAFAFASNDTVMTLSAALTVPLLAYGNAMTVAFIGAADAANRPVQTAKALIRDSFSLAQTGCMSVRSTVVLGKLSESARKSFAHAVGIEGHRVIKGYLNAATETALDQDIPLWLGRGASVAVRSAPDEPLVPCLLGSIQSYPPLISERRFVVPILYSDRNASDALLAMGQQMPELRHIALSPALHRPSIVAAAKGLRIAALGAANAPTWDGTHQGQPLFQLP